ncbi:MAG: glycine dehydrogenase (aminomethyl-transferring) [Acidobacteria bacterium]|nr:MAG: glycine dehydrogenase (aminomethyl-transferring) [Acidobacteriota bacterium]
MPHPTERFQDRHIGPRVSDVEKMLATIGATSLDDLIDQTVPGSILDTELNLPDALTEPEVVARLQELAGLNQVLTSLIGLGYHDTIMPPVIQRNVLENPAWYTAYTPYQPEISQGRLEALLNFQTMVSDLTGLDIANASLLDEPTAAAEAMAMSRRLYRGDGKIFYIDPDCHEPTKAVVGTRARAAGIDVRDMDDDVDPSLAFGVLLQYPGSSGAIRDHRDVADSFHEANAVVVVAADLLSLTMLTPPGEWGADIAVGSAQRFGVPFGYGGPHAGFISTRKKLVRGLPGRLVGVSKDSAGRLAYRLALQTREQHIRREKATSNVCTAQVLLAVIAGLYGCWHGPEGLKAIAGEVNRLTTFLAEGLAESAYRLTSETWFDTITVRTPGRATEIIARALKAGINLGFVDDDHVRISLDEKTTEKIVLKVLVAFGAKRPHSSGVGGIPVEATRKSAFMTHPVFSLHQSEHEMLRYLRRLADRDLALDRSMIPLGSCTMKLNATTEMIPMTWSGFADIHPYVPIDQAAGYMELIRELETYLADITGYDTVSLQPNAGSQGELAGLLAISAYHRSRGDEHRDVCLIPASAHGTNAASAVMAGMRVVVVATDDGGNVDLDDLDAKAADHADELAVAMVTYPSTHGVFEEEIKRLTETVHSHGGQVYVDGANLNALVGLARPAEFGADIGHLNLHKTFTIPHGGGGPGIGPVGAVAHLAPFLPSHPLLPAAGPETGIGPVSGAPFGSAGILPIPYAYVRLMGADGLRQATRVAILSANYVARRLDPHFPVLYSGQGGRVAHECLLDLRPLAKETGITAEDVAKRLIDYGFHAPTLSFPVAGTLMVEPTESESLEELDRFCEAMIAIRSEADRVGSGEWPLDDNPLVLAPHTTEDVAANDWDRAYTREEAAFPVESLRFDKYWPPVGRIDGVGGDRNLICACPPLDAYR